MNFINLKKNMTSKALLLALFLFPLLGAFSSSAQADDHHRGRGNRHVNRHVYRGGRGYDLHRGYAGRGHHGYWRRYHGRRYWYEDGGYYASPGGVSISIGL